MPVLPFSSSRPEICLVRNGRTLQELVAGDGNFGRFAIADCEACDGEGRFFAGEEPLERFLAANAVHGHVGVVVKRCNADVLYAHGGRNFVDRIARDFELVACIGTGLVHAFLGGVAAFGRVVTDYVRHVVFGGGIFPGDSVKACRIQELALVLFGVVADFASAGSGFPAVRAQVAPVTLVVAVALRNVVFLVHEGVVKQAEFEPEQYLVARDGRVVVVCRIDGDAPRGLFEQTIKMRQEFGLVILGGEVDSEIELGAVDMIFAPVPETRLHKGDARIVILFRGEVGVELLVEPQEFLVAPVGVVGGAVAARVFGIRLGVRLVCLDVQGDGGDALDAFGAVGRQYENPSEIEPCKSFWLLAWSGQNTIPFMGSSVSISLLSATERSAAKDIATSMPVANAAVVITGAAPAKTNLFIPHSVRDDARPLTSNVGWQKSQRNTFLSTLFAPIWPKIKKILDIVFFCLHLVW